MAIEEEFIENIPEEFNPKLYGFQFIDENAKPKLLKLNKYNAGLVEYMIANNSSYGRSGNKDAKPAKNKKGKNKGELKEKGYHGSEAYWLTELKQKLETNTSEWDYETIIKYCVIAIDSENRTHLNSDVCGREEITKRILEIKSENLKKLLQNDDKNYELLKKISAATNPENTKKGSKKNYKSRENLSFASKFCHFASYYLFEENEKYQFGYSIYDGVMGKAIGVYANHFNIDYHNFDKRIDSGENIVQFYKNYQKSIDEILKQNGNEINRQQFDHLLWYYYKAHSEELDEK